MLSQILEREGKIPEAADTLGDLAVETFGSMERREKHEIILEQMRLYMLREDWSRMAIVGRKINTKFFDDEKQHVGVPRSFSCIFHADTSCHRTSNCDTTSL